MFTTLKSLRKKHGLTQEQAASQAHVSKSVISAVESGRQRNLTPAMQRALLAFMHRLQMEETPASGKPGKGRHGDSD